MISYTRKPYILFGGDYNPNQWDQEVIAEDMRFFRDARINTVTLPVFSWAKLEPEEGVYCFEELDSILDLLEKNEISYFLATPTSAQPAWMSQRYPEMLPVDIEGRKRTHGMRMFFCVNSEKYRERAAGIAAEMAQRYKNRKGLVGWHVANEYGTSCYCDTCKRKFQKWLLERYQTIEQLNQKWETEFWGKTLYHFEEVELPSKLNNDDEFNPALELDFQRFKTDSTIACFENEARILKEATPNLPVFTNISGYIKKLNQFKMVNAMDVAGWDNYPGPRDPRSLTALKHDIMRAACGGNSYFVAEQSPAQQNWQPYNKLKKPGEIRRIAYQGLGHGADSSLYFQMRQSRAGQEKMHGAVITRVGTNTTRTFKEIAQIGMELELLGNRFVGARIEAEVGILFDWENWWALELCSGPSRDKDYLDEVHRIYRPFYEKNIPVDIVRYEDDLTKYKIVMAPCLYMMKDKIEQKISEYVKSGGIFVTGYLSGYVDENDRCVYGAYPGPLKDVLGIYVEETDALYPEEENVIQIATTHKCFRSKYLCDLIKLDGAEVIAVYKEDFYRGNPAFTVNYYGSGKAYYLATRPEEEFYDWMTGMLTENAGIESDFLFKGELEIDCRIREGKKTWFLINFGSEDAIVDLKKDSYLDLLSNTLLTGDITIPKGDLIILGLENQDTDS